MSAEIEVRTSVTRMPVWTPVQTKMQTSHKQIRRYITEHKEGARQGQERERERFLERCCVTAGAAGAHCRTIRCRSSECHSPSAVRRANSISPNFVMGRFATSAGLAPSAAAFVLHWERDFRLEIVSHHS